MPRPVRLADFDIVVQGVPDAVRTRGGVMDYAIKTGQATPATFGMDVETEASALTRFNAGMGRTFTRIMNNVGLMDRDTRTQVPGLAGGLGESAPYMLAGAAVPAAFPALAAGTPAVVAQSLAAGGVASLIGEDAGGIAKEMAFGAVGQAGGDLLSSAGRGVLVRLHDALMARAGQASIRPVTRRSLQTLSETLGGMQRFNRQQQDIVNQAWADSIGESGERSLTNAVRDRAARRIGQVMDDALPIEAVDVTDAYVQLDSIPSEVFPGKARVMRLLERAELDPPAYQEAMAELREAMRNAGSFNGEVARGFDMLGEAGQRAGAANTRIAREQYKNLMLVESLNATWNSGDVSAPMMARAMRTGRSGYGNATVRQGGANTLEPTQRAIQTTQDAAEETAQRFRSSGTTERAVQQEAAEAGVGLLTGRTDPSSVLQQLGKIGLVGPLSGLAAVGGPTRYGGAVGVAGQQIERARREADE